MRRYQLFAARDGEVIETTIQANDEEEARAIAAHRMNEEFGLEADLSDFDEISADTDGVTLDEVTDDSLADAAASWACAQLPFLDHLKGAIGGLRGGEIARVTRGVGKGEKFARRNVYIWGRLGLGHCRRGQGQRECQQPPARVAEGDAGEPWTMH